MSIPPDREMTFIRIPTPRTIRITFHGIPLIAFFSSPQPSTISTDPTRKPVSPTFQEKNNTPTARMISPAKRQPLLSVEFWKYFLFFFLMLFHFPAFVIYVYQHYYNQCGNRHTNHDRNGISDKSLILHQLTDNCFASGVNGLILPDITPRSPMIAVMIGLIPADTATGIAITGMIASDGMAPGPTAQIRNPRMYITNGIRAFSSQPALPFYGQAVPKSHYC